MAPTLLGAVHLGKDNSYLEEFATEFEARYNKVSRIIEGKDWQRSRGVGGWGAGRTKEILRAH